MLLFQLFSQQALSTSLNLADSSPEEQSLHMTLSSNSMGDEHHDMKTGCDDGDCMDLFCQTICHTGVTLTLSDLLIPGLSQLSRLLPAQPHGYPLGTDLYPETKPPKASL